MSDTEFPGSAPDSLPGGAGWPGESSASALEVVAHPVYEVAYCGGRIFAAGANGPLRFEISRRDGVEVSLPSTAQIVVELPDGTSAALTPDLQQAGAATVVALCCDFPFSERGIFAARLLATIESEVIGAWVETLICEG